MGALRAIRLLALLPWLRCCPCFSPTAATRARRRSLPPLPGHASSEADDASSPRRRLLLAAPTLLLPLTGANAHAAETAAESIRLLSSKTIPGLGPPDVYYPPYFVGKWRVTKIVASSDDAFWSGINLPVTTVSEMRFVPYDAGKEFTSYENPSGVPAVADRSFNEKSYYAALSDELHRVYAKRAMPPIQSLNWVATNPNVLSLAYTDGSSKEVKVTKRSSDVSQDGNGVFSSEFRRITDVPASNSVAGGIPTIYKSRVLTKWKPGAGAEGTVDVIEGIEITYNERGTLGERDASNSFDPLTGRGGSGAISSLYGGDSKDLSDWRSTKTKILMERITG